MIRWLTPVLALCAVLVAAPGRSAWGPSGCAAVAVPLTFAPAVQATPRYEWVRGADPAQLHLTRDGRQIGTYRRDTRQYHPFDGWTWGTATAVPASAPALPPAGRIEAAPDCDCCEACSCADDCQCATRGRPCEDGCRCVFTGAEEMPPWATDGVDRMQIDGPKYKINGKPATRERVMEALASGQLVDDSHKLRVTVIGTPAERKQVLGDFESDPALKALWGHVLLQAYDPGDWAVKDAGFHTGGKPTIYCQAPSGKVLHRQDDYDGPQALAEAIRKADPTYDPSKDVDRRKQPGPAPAPQPDPDDEPAPAGLPSWAWWVLTALASLLGLSWLPSVVRAGLWIYGLVKRLKQPDPTPAPAPAPSPLTDDLLKKLLDTLARLNPIKEEGPPK